MKAFTRLVASVKCEMDLQLAPCTAIVGPNQSTKTAILDAYRLALTGKHPIGADAADVYELAAPGQTGVYAALYTDDGRKISYQLSAESGKPKSPTHDTFEVFGKLSAEQTGQLLPWVSVGSMLQSPSAVREELLRRFGGSHAIPEPAATLAASQLTLWREIVAETKAEIGGNPDASRVLSEMGSVLRSRKARKSKEASALERAINERMNASQGEDTAGAEMLPTLERQLQRAQAWEQSAALRARRTQLETTLAESEPIVTRRDVTALQNEIAVSQEQLQRLDKQRQLSTAVVELVAVSTEQCRLCKQGQLTAERKTQLLAAPELFITATQQTKQALQAAQNRLQAITQQEANERTLHQLWMQSRSRLQGELEGLVSALARVPESYAGPTSVELTKQIASLRLAQTTKQLLTADSNRLRELRIELEDIKVLEKEAVRLGTSLLRTIADTATTAVNKHMPQDLRVTLEITPKECNWRVGGTDGRAHRRGGMSGREYGSLCVALSLAWVADAPVRVLLLEDLDLGCFDKRNIGVLFNTIHTAVEAGELTQALIVWSRADEIPPNWEKIYR